MRLVLIGFSGVGKSTVGQMVAARLGWAFFDTDDEIERAAGRRIFQIFDQDGEPGFRRWEAQAVAKAVEEDDRVIAVGGGAVVDPANRRALKSGGLVVLLEGAVETLLERLRADVADEPRPMLESADPRGRMAALKKARKPIYLEMADLVVSTDGLSPEEVADRVVAATEAKVLRANEARRGRK